MWTTVVENQISWESESSALHDVQFFATFYRKDTDGFYHGFLLHNARDSSREVKSPMLHIHRYHCGYPTWNNFLREEVFPCHRSSSGTSHKCWRKCWNSLVTSTVAHDSMNSELVPSVPQKERKAEMSWEPLLTPCLCLCQKFENKRTDIYIVQFILTC